MFVNSAVVVTKHIVFLGFEFWRYIHEMKDINKIIFKVKDKGKGPFFVLKYDIRGKSGICVSGCLEGNGV